MKGVEERKTGPREGTLVATTATPAIYGENTNPFTVMSVPNFCFLEYINQLVKKLKKKSVLLLNNLNNLWLPIFSFVHRDDQKNKWKMEIFLNKIQLNIFVPKLMMMSQH